MASLYREHTPIDEVIVNGKTVFVKRDDLFGRLPAPPLGKLRGMRIVLRKLYDSGVRLVGCWDTRVSKLGQGLAAACREFPGMHSVIFYPTKIGTPQPEAILRAAALGARIVPLRGNHAAICCAQAKRKIEALGGVMLPFGLECEDAVFAIAKEAARVPTEICRGTLLLSCGSGVTLAGLLIGLKQLPQHALGLSSGRSLAKIRACVQRYVSTPPSCVELLEPLMPYDQVSTASCPFPAHPNYDLKAWDYLGKHVRKLRQPILFWNIGA